MNTIKEKIEKEIEKGLDDIKILDPSEQGTQGYGQTVRNISELNKMYLEVKKFEQDEKDKKSKRWVEITDKLIGHAITGVAAFGSWSLYKSYLDKGFEFEKTGNFTSKTFMNLIGKIRIK